MLVWLPSKSNIILSFYYFWLTGCLGYPGASTVASQPLDRKTAPMAGKSPQPSHEPPFQAEGTLRADAARSERERGAQGWGKPWPRTTQVPRHPTRTTRKRERYARKYLSSEKACHPHDSTDGSVNIDLIRIAGPSAKCLDEVIW